MFVCLEKVINEILFCINSNSVYALNVIRVRLLFVFSFYHVHWHNDYIKYTQHTSFCSFFSLLFFFWKLNKACMWKGGKFIFCFSWGEFCFGKEGRTFTAAFSDEKIERKTAANYSSTKFFCFVSIRPHISNDF